MPECDHEWWYDGATCGRGPTCSKCGDEQPFTAPARDQDLVAAKAVLANEALRLKAGGGGHGGGSSLAKTLVAAIERVLIELGGR